MASKTLEVQAPPALSFDMQEGRDLCSIADFSPEELEAVLELAAVMKLRPHDFRGALDSKTIVLFFEKPSFRTRLTFESGIHALGGKSFFVDQTLSPLGVREPLRDMAKNLERWVDGIVLRTFAHVTITGMAEHAAVPVINALSDLEHPCQALADFLALQERFGDLRNVRLAYVGDGNNVAHSLMLAAASLGSTITVAVPPGYGPLTSIYQQALGIASETGAEIILTHDPVEAVIGADAVYTDVWASMGQETEVAAREEIFADFQVNAKLMAHAASHALFMHCLPAHRGAEVTSEVIDGDRSIIFEQAANRLHAQKAVLLTLLGGGMRRFPPHHA